MTDFILDWDREERTGIAEAILCDGKIAAHIDAILDAADGKRLLLTRLAPAALASLKHRDHLDYDPLSATAFWGRVDQAARSGAGVVCAGTSDLPVAREAARTLEFFGFQAPIIADVGVAGLWRLNRHMDDIRRFKVVIAVAGMEGALFSVLAGMTRALVIAVPAPTGYGVAAGGQAALTSALASCAPGIVTVNIGNGFGAACAAIKALN